MATETIAQYKAKVLISKELSAQIAYLHNKCKDDTEWSGLLIYEVLKGGLEDLQNLELKAHAVFPMDFGDATFTSFEASDYWLSAFEKFPQVDPLTPQPGWYIGKIHTHHNMSVFHSQTDKNDLHATAENLPMFLSLIVNYKTKTDCELAIVIEAEEEVTTKIKWKLKGWKLAKEEQNVKKVDNKRVFVIKCEVDYEQEDWFKLQVQNVEKGSRRVPVHTTGHGYGSGYGYGHSTFRQEEFEWAKAYKGPKETPKTDESKNVTWTGRAYQLMLANAPDLFTLGMGHTMTVKDALDKTNLIVEAHQATTYKKAFMAYFDEWYKKVYSSAPDLDEMDAVAAAKLLLSYHKEVWIVKTINTALDELAAYYRKKLVQQV